MCEKRAYITITIITTYIKLIFLCGCRYLQLMQLCTKIWYFCLCKLDLTTLAKIIKSQSYSYMKA